MNSTPLHSFGDWIRNALIGIPLPTVRWIFIACLVAVLLAVWRLPNSETTPETGSQRWDDNLKIWASLALIIQIVIYSVI